MFRTRCGVLGSLAALLLAVSACAGAPVIPPPDRTPLATSRPDHALASAAVTATATPKATDTPDSALVAALGPLGLSGLASQFVTPQPLLAPPVTPRVTATRTPVPAAPSLAASAAVLAAPAQRAPTDTPMPAVAPQPSPVPATLPPLAVTDANIRTGPGLEFAIAGSVRAGTVLDIVACNADRTWYRLADGNWIFATLVINAPRALQVVDPPSP